MDPHLQTFLFAMAVLFAVLIAIKLFFKVLFSLPRWTVKLLQMSFRAWKSLIQDMILTHRAKKAGMEKIGDNKNGMVFQMNSFVPGDIKAQCDKMAAAGANSSEIADYALARIEHRMAGERALEGSVPLPPSYAKILASGKR